MAKQFSRAIRYWGHPKPIWVFAVIGLLLAWPYLSSSRPAPMPHAGFKLLHHSKPPDVDRLALAATGPVTRLVPQGNVKAIVLLLSDRDGWTATMQHDAKVLSGAGIAVAGVDTPRLLRRLAGSRASCISLNWSLSLLAKDFEHRLGLPVYMRPILAGRGLGGDVTFASLAQSPNIFRGGVSLGFDGQLPASKAWCTNRRPLASRLSGAHAGWQLRTGQSFTTPWVAIASRERERAIVRRFLPTLPHSSLRLQAGDALLSAILPMAEAPMAKRASASDTTIEALPLDTMVNPASRSTPYMAVFYSGDGGWVGFDRNMASALADHGVPVVGIDSLSYFWNKRRPTDAAADLARVINHYRHLWGRRQVILVGFSFGADNLPFIANALPKRLHPDIARISLLGLSDSTDFQFHLESWLDMTQSDAMPTVPAIMGIRDMPVQCVRGTVEADSACNAIPKGRAIQSILPGDHHFGRDFSRIAHTILAGLET